MDVTNHWPVSHDEMLVHLVDEWGQRGVLNKLVAMSNDPVQFAVDVGKASVDRSVQPEWCRHLPLQQQSVLFLAARGPDGIPKKHPCKDVVRAYRGTVLVAARLGRCLRWGEDADTFMSLADMADLEAWTGHVRWFFQTVDQLPHHYVLHLGHGAEIIGYKHPDERFRNTWLEFYHELCRDMHMSPETENQMDERLNDWERKAWQ